MNRLLYNKTLKALDRAVAFANDKQNSKLTGMLCGKKTESFIAERKRLIREIEESMSGETRPVYWFHASSLGEYAVIRPLMQSIHHSQDKCIVLTFFSPTGCEALKGKTPAYSSADYVFPLPIDTPENARKFTDTIKPQKVVFAVSEFWPNFLDEVSKRDIPIFLVSAIIRRNSVFFKWYGNMYRNTLKAFTSIFVLDKESAKNLNTLGCDNVHITRNPLFDNAISVSRAAYRDDVIENFCGKDKDIFIAGSISDKKDLKLISSLANKHNDIKFIIIPHEISEETLNNIKYHLRGNAKIHSECTPNTDFTGVQVLIIDFIGALSRIYRYGRYAYVGGGFTPFLHSVIEATVYGLPVSFGPCIHRKITPQQMIELGIGEVVRTPKELDTWFSRLKRNEQLLEQIKTQALSYAMQNEGGTQEILSLI